MDRPLPIHDDQDAPEAEVAPAVAQQSPALPSMRQAGTAGFVATLAGLGVPEEDIARLNGCDLETLRSRFGEALAHGAALAEADYRRGLFQRAKEGNVPAAIQWRRENPPKDAAPVKRPRGRPSVYDQATADEICRRMAHGESLRAICRTEGMPSEGTVRSWAMDDREGFFSQYTRARELQAHAIAEAAYQEGITATDPQLGRLAFDARRWFAGKVLPKVYSDKVQTEVSGPDGAALPVVVYVPANNRD